MHFTFLPADERVANGYRFSEDGSNLTIQDLVTGRWVEIGLHRLPGDKESYIAGGARVLGETAYRLPELAARFERGDRSRLVSVNEVIGVLSSSPPERMAPVFPLPAIATIKAHVSPYPGCRPISGGIHADVTAISQVATALAWRGGTAREFELEHDLAIVLDDPTAAWRPLEIARTRTSQNILKCGKGPHALWKMISVWSSTPWVETAPAQMPQPRHGGATTDKTPGYHPPEWPIS